MRPTRRAALATLAALGAAGPAALAQQVPGARKRPWPARQPVPALRLPAVDGPDFALGAQKGQVVVLNFWASWCEPCRAEMPSLELLEQRHLAQGLRVLAVNFRESEATVRRYLAQSALSLTVLRDSDGAAARAWGVRVFPSTIVVDRNGRPAFTVIGEVDWTGATARQWIAAVL